MQPSQSTLITIILGASIGALVFAVLLAKWVLARSTGTPEMRKISDAIQEGAEAYLARQYKTISVLAVAVAALLAVGYGVLRSSAPSAAVNSRTALAIYITISFLLGALSSGIAGFMGMWVVMLVIAIVYGIKAGRGEWAEYPLLGRLSRKTLKIGPNGMITMNSH